MLKKLRNGFLMFFFHSRIFCCCFWKPIKSTFITSTSIFAHLLQYSMFRFGWKSQICWLISNYFRLTCQLIEIVTDDRACVCASPSLLIAIHSIEHKFKYILICIHIGNTKCQFQFQWTDTIKYANYFKCMAQTRHAKLFQRHIPIQCFSIGIFQIEIFIESCHSAVYGWLTILFTCLWCFSNMFNCTDEHIHLFILIELWIFIIYYLFRVAVFND